MSAPVRCFAFLLAFATVACEGTTDPPSGESANFGNSAYRLTSINGQALPYATGSAAGAIIAGQLSVTATKAWIFADTTDGHVFVREAGVFDSVDATHFNLRDSSALGSIRYTGLAIDDNIVTITNAGTATAWAWRFVRK